MWMLSRLEDTLRSLLFWDPDDALHIYEADAPSVELDRNTLVGAHGQLVIRRSALEGLLARYPDTGKLLKAMQEEALHPESPNFDVGWTAAKRAAVEPSEVFEILEDLQLSEPACVRFLRVFSLGHSNDVVETYPVMNLAFLQQFDSGLQALKHAFVQHWMDVACFTACHRVPQEPSALMLLKGNDKGIVVGLECLGPAIPPNFQSCESSLRHLDVVPSLDLKEAAACLLQLEHPWTRQGGQEVHAILSQLEQGLLETPRFEGLELLRLLHVQLRLASFKVAEVDGPMNREQLEFLSRLLSCQILFLDSEDHLKKALKQLAEPEKALLVLSDLPPERNLAEELVRTRPQAARCILSYRLGEKALWPLLESIAIR